MRGRGSLSWSWRARSVRSALSWKCSGRCLRNSSSPGSTRSIHRATDAATPETLYLGGFRTRRRQRRPRMALERGQEALRVEGGHAARPGRRDRLAVGAVLHVSRGEHTWDVGLGRARLRDQVAARVMIELLEEELGVGVVADRDEQAIGIDLPGVAGRRVAQPQPFHLRVAKDLGDLGI